MQYIHYRQYALKNGIPHISTETSSRLDQSSLDESPIETQLYLWFRVSSRYKIGCQTFYHKHFGWTIFVYPRYYTKWRATSVFVKLSKIEVIRWKPYCVIAPLSPATK